VPGRAATIYDVARAAGVSPTTVSHVLNGKGRVHAATRERVLAAARELGFRASPVARRLSHGRTRALGLLLPGDIGGDTFASYDFYVRVAAAAAATAFAVEDSVLLLPHVDDMALRRVPVDGVIVTDPEEHDARIGALLAAGLPVVTIDRDLGRPDQRWFVATDHERATRALLDHLHGAGARRIVLLTAPARLSWLAGTREAYERWCAEHRLAARVVEARSPDSVAAATARLLAGVEPPDAIFSPPERHAVVVARAARERGLRVGADLLVASGVDSPEARLHDPPITAIDQDPDAHGAAAVRLLQALVAGEQPDAPVWIPAALRPRGSTSGRPVG
jgi:DNA-binding LacI/PurR family transcriptional regulator